MFLRLFLVEIALYGVEDAVDELGSFVSGKAAGNFECFIDCDSARRWFVQKFINRETQDIAINDRHSRNAPVFRSRADTLVKRVQMRKRALRKPRREITRGVFRVSFAQLRPVSP